MDISFSRKLRTFGLLMLLFLCACGVLAAPASAAEYSDIQGHWNQKVIEKWSDTGVLSGYADGTFRPNNPVTRGQLATVLYRIWGCDPVEEGFAYPDLSKGHWCYDALNTLNMYGVALNTDDRILPDEPLTREEAFYMIAKVFSVGADQNVRTNEFLHRVSDWDAVSDRYTSRLMMMVADRYVNGSSDGRLNPKRGITRAEVMKVIDNMIDVYISKPGTYDVYFGQNILVTCSGVTLNQVMQPQGYVNSRYTGGSCTYLFGGDAAEGGVTFRNGVGEKGAATFLVYTVSQDEPSWNTEGRCTIRKEDTRTAKTYPFPDTRFSGGRGQLFFPYVINTPEQFKLLAEFQDDGKLSRQSFKLACDLDLGTLSEPVCPGAAVEGNLDGGGHTVTYQMTSAVLEQPAGGLFFEWKGRVQNLTLEGTVDAAFSEKVPQEKLLPLAFGGFSGSLVGDMENCVSKMNITARLDGIETGRLCVGGLVGLSLYADFDGCRGEGNVCAMMTSTQGSCNAGGILGSGTTLGPMYRGADFSRCGASGMVAAQGGSHAYAGGIVGSLSYAENVADNWPEGCFGSLEHCWSTARVSAANVAFQSEAGGLVGQVNGGTVKGCWAKPVVTILNGGSFENVGAIAGSCRIRASITDCWANAVGVDMGGNLHAGGITGRLEGAVANCYVIGASQFESCDAITFQEWNDGTLSSCADFTDAAAKAPFLKACGWDFTNVWDAGGTYPILRGCDRAAQQRAQT